MNSWDSDGCTTYGVAECDGYTRATCGILPPAIVIQSQVDVRQLMWSSQLQFDADREEKMTGEPNQ